MTATDPQLAAMPAERLAPAAAAYVEDMSTGPPSENDRARRPSIVTPGTPAGRSGASCSLAPAARGHGPAPARRPGRRTRAMRLRRPAGGREEA